MCLDPVINKFNKVGNYGIQLSDALYLSSLQVEILLTHIRLPEMSYRQ